MKDNTDSIDILLATFNGEQYIRQQIDSIIRQTYTNWTLLVHDDGSSDETLSVIKTEYSWLAERIHVIDDGIRFGSPVGNFGFLVTQSTAKYVMFCDQDDIWLPNKVEVSLRRMKEVEQSHSDSPVLVCTDLAIVASDLKVVSESMRRYQRLEDAQRGDSILLENWVTGCTVMINTELKALAVPVPSVAVVHDWWFALIAHYFGVISFVNEPLVLYRQHSGNDTGAKSYALSSILHRIGSGPVALINHVSQKTSIIRSQLLEIQKLLASHGILCLGLDKYLSARSLFDRRYVLLKYRLLGRFGVKALGKLLVF